MKSIRMLSFCVGLGALGLGACHRSAGHGASVRRADCDTLDYSSRSLSARVEIPDRAGIELHTSKQAIRDVDAWVEKYFAAWTTVCRDYKNGALTREEYRDESQRIRTAMERFEELALRLENAATPEAFDEALREAWTTVAPPEERVDLRLELRVMAKRPGETEFAVVPPGVALPTGTKLYALVRLDAAANLQLYQVNARGERTVLFPDPRIAATNPLPAGVELRLPPNGVFELDDRDLGIEDLHVLATSEALPAARPPATAGAGDCGTRGLTFVADACPKSRGLQFTPEPGAYSMKAANAAAERGVHLVYTFHHVGDAATYGNKCADVSGDACLGIEPGRSVLTHRPPRMPDDFAQCPDGAVAKEMPGPAGSYERWCVELDPQGHLVDHGPYRKWHGSGTLWVRGQLDMGRRAGTWSTFDAQGERLGEVTY